VNCRGFTGEFLTNWLKAILTRPKEEILWLRWKISNAKLTGDIPANGIHGDNKNANLRIFQNILFSGNALK